MTSAIIIVGIIGIALLIWNAVNRNGFENDYRFDGEFAGELYECNLRFANYEYDTQVFIGANRSGLCLLSHPVSRSWWRYKGEPFKKNLQIPWSDLDCRAGGMFFKDRIWFDIPSRKIHFYVPKHIGDKLLRDAERQIPDRTRR